MRPLVIVRPQPGADATAQAAERLGLSPITMPLFAVEPIHWEVPDVDGFDGLLLTSANAPRHAGDGLERLRSLPAHCVGAATAEAARNAGLNVETIGAGGVEALLATLPPGLRLLHLCGEHRREPGTVRHEIAAVPVYRSRELPRPDGFERIEGAVAAVHSPRAASVLARHVDAAGLDRGTIGLATISAETSEAAGDGWADAQAAAEPGDPALLAIALRLCNKPH